ncbi:hormone receptor 4-like isoform X3 [Homarus americanus]|uniref:hormone receptor 4-like isoform X3 n=1 Tax=Homarus americanus TaxID=6706 RepID=UPI001C45A846|nr:hormone receptor 4-like isoform X3 [Homarus americanus]
MLTACSRPCPLRCCPRPYKPLKRNRWLRGPHTPHNYGIMTVTLLQCEGVKMSLFQDLKLKRRKVDSRDGESLAETSSCSPDSGSSGGETSSCSPVQPPASYLPSESPRSSPNPRPHIHERASPDSAGGEFGEVKSCLDCGQDDDTQDAHVFDGGGRQPVSSSAMPRPSAADSALHPVQKCEDTDMPERMSTTPPPPDTSEHPPEITSVSIGTPLPPPLVSLGPPLSTMPHTLSVSVAGLSPGIVTSAGLRCGPPVSVAQPYWGGGASRINGMRPEFISGGMVQPTQSTNVPSAAPADSSRAGYSPRLRTPTVIMGEAGGVKTMFWSTPSETQTSASQAQREVLTQPATPCAYGADTSDAVRASVDGLLTLGQDRRGSPPQLSPTSTLSLSPAARSPITHSARSPHTHTPIARSPYTVAPSSPGYQVVRCLGSPQSSGDLQLLHNTSYIHSPTSVDSQRHPSTPLNMERLWAGDRTQLPHTQPDSPAALNLSTVGMWGARTNSIESVVTAPAQPTPVEEDEEDQPMICMICEDRATGLHYGIITCEGCKGFFKRTVQNKRVYTCVADGDCEITKAQRNRCQYCRFQKCLRQGMVLAAVREDRMPGGRNSGAVYNLYKVKYKKKNKKNGQIKQGGNSPEKKMVLDPLMMPGTTSLTSPSLPMPISSPLTSPPITSPIPSGLNSGPILKAALTNPSEVAHFRQRLDNTVSSTRERTMPYPVAQAMIRMLIECDDFEDIATLKNLDDLLDHKSDLSTKLCQLGDSISIKLVQWTKRLPFYQELPVEVHTRLLTHKWHELLVLTTSAYQAIYGLQKLASRSSDGTEAEFHQEVSIKVSNNLCTLQTCLNSMMGRPITMDQLRQEVGVMVEKITHVTLALRKTKIQIEEYVCLKVIAMLNQTRSSHKELEVIQERYMNCLRSFCETHYPSQPTRYQDLLVRLPDIQAAAAKLLETKMLYVPFLLNSTINR